jgi:hypothetical protein
MMEAARTSETLVSFYQTIRGYNPEDSHLRTHRRENLKSYFDKKRTTIDELFPEIACLLFKGLDFYVKLLTL